ncbi:hypothetical protein AAF712_002511 [Marasmius tenuissimus]|uniref:BHLH domain-containing protein n=1 Tax=Marasmius tenuissimus TaxID=585030 RepID=A0ABR3AAG0_9AGAR
MASHPTNRPQHKCTSDRLTQTQLDSNNEGKKRATLSLADRRATHTAVEKIRRDALNKRIQTLASLVPAPAGARPSKYRVVNSTISHLQASREHRVLAARELRNLETEASTLRNEVNVWRLRAGRMPMREERRSASYHSIVNGEMEVDYGTGLEREFLERETKNLADAKDGEGDEGDEDGDGHDAAIVGSNELETSLSGTNSDSPLPTSLIHPPPSPFSLLSLFLPNEVGFGTHSQRNSGENMFRYYQTNLWNSHTSSQHCTMSQRDIKLIH